jgi:phage terminase small subunit
MPILDNAKHELFAQQIARGKTLTEAQTIAGLSENAGNAVTMRDRPEVTERIKELKSVAAARANVSAERVLAELARIGFADITETIKIVDGKVQVADTAQLSADTRAAISEISQGRDGIKVKLHDKRAALENLGKHLGLFKENIDLNVNVSLADLVNGSYKLERGELTPDSAPAIEHKAPAVDDPEPQA